MKERAEPAVVFARTGKDYRRLLAAADLGAAARVLGVSLKGDNLEIPFFGRTFRVGPAGVFGPDNSPPGFSAMVILAQLLLRCPERPPVADGKWAAFRDFPDAAPLLGYFTARVEGSLQRFFRGRLLRLAAACGRLPGRPEPGYPHDLAWRLEALPHLSLLLLFNDADEELPAACSLLFPGHAGVLLDMECLAMLGELLCGMLEE